MSLQVGLQAQPQFQALVELRRLRCRVRVVERVFVRLGCLGPAVAPDGGGPSDQVPAVDVIAGVDPLSCLLVLVESRIQPPVDAGTVQVHEFAAVNAQCCHGRETLVEAHQHREVGVRQEDCPGPGQCRNGYGNAQEVLVVAAPAGEGFDGGGRGKQQFVVHARTLPVPGDGLVTNKRRAES